MTVGMSAPPIGRMSRTPKTSARPASTAKYCHCVGSRTSMTEQKTAMPSSRKVTRFWLRYVTGRVGMISWSLPAAMRAPVRVRKPSRTSIEIATVRKVVSSPGWCSQSMYLAVPTRPTAVPPNASASAVRCGTAVSGTRDSGMPMNVPAMSATTIHLYSTISGKSRVPMMAAVMPDTPASTPRRAVLGCESHLSDRTKRPVAIR
jgi:hypothetical protein